MTLAIPLDRIRATRSSVKWTRYPSDVIPLSVAEMDYPIAEPIADTIVARVRAADLGYIDGPGPLATAFADFSQQRWGWRPDAARVRVATDVSVGIVETLRYGIAPGSAVVITPPVYPPFAELIEEAGARQVDVPLISRDGAWSLDLPGLERAFAAGAAALLLCNPHNPMGLVHDASTLRDVAELAARYDVLVVSDEVHAPLTHPGVTFTPFASAAATSGAQTRSVTVTSASKGWNLAGTKCALVIADDAASTAIVDRFPEEVACRTSILGLHANLAALACTDWLDETVERIVAADALVARLVAEQLPGVVYIRPEASYLGWLDFRAVGLGDDPAAWILSEARVALNSGPSYGLEGRGHARINLACDPDLLIEAVHRIADALSR